MSKDNAGNGFFTRLWLFITYPVRWAWHKIIGEKQQDIAKANTDATPNNNVQKLPEVDIDSQEHKADIQADNPDIQASIIGSNTQTDINTQITGTKKEKTKSKSPRSILSNTKGNGTRVERQSLSDINTGVHKPQETNANIIKQDVEIDEAPTANIDNSHNDNVVRKVSRQNQQTNVGVQIKGPELDNASVSVQKLPKINIGNQEQSVGIQTNNPLPVVSVNTQNANEIRSERISDRTRVNANPQEKQNISSNKTETIMTNTNTELFQDLQSAVQDRNYDLVTKYLSKDISPDFLASKEMNSLLVLSIENGHPKIAKLFVEKGVDISTNYSREEVEVHSDYDKSSTTKFGEPPLTLAIRNLDKDFKGYEELIELMLKTDPSIVNRESKVFKSLRSEYQKKKITEWTNLRYDYEGGETALHVAVQHRYTSIVKLLLEYGADPRIIRSRDDASCISSPMVYINGDDPDTVEPFLNSVVKHEVESKMRNNPNKIKKEIESEVVRFHLKSALGIAIARLHINIVEFLFTKYPESENCCGIAELSSMYKKVDSKGREKLEYAMSRLRDKAVQDEYALHRAANSGNVDMINFLLKKEDCDVNKKEPLTIIVGTTFGNKIYRNGKAALHYAISPNNIPGKPYPEEKDCIGAIKLLLDNGADPSLPEDVNGNTPLHIAANLGRINMVKLLLEKGADPKILNKAGKRPLDHAIKSETGFCFEGIIELLIERTIDDKEDVMTLAINHGLIDILNSLIKRRVVNIDVFKNNTPELKNLYHVSRSHKKSLHDDSGYDEKALQFIAEYASDEVATKTLEDIIGRKSTAGKNAATMRSFLEMKGGIGFLSNEKLQELLQLTEQYPYMTGIFRKYSATKHQCDKETLLKEFKQQITIGGEVLFNVTTELLGRSDIDIETLKEMKAAMKAVGCRDKCVENSIDNRLKKLEQPIEYDITPLIKAIKNKNQGELESIFKKMDENGAEIDFEDEKVVHALSDIKAKGSRTIKLVFDHELKNNPDKKKPDRIASDEKLSDIWDKTRTALTEPKVTGHVVIQK